MTDMCQEIRKAIEQLDINKSFVKRFAPETIACYDTAIRVMKEYLEYSAVGTVEEFAMLKQRATSMEIEDVHVDEYYCPNCGSENGCNDKVVGDNFCPVCEQAFLKEKY